MNTYRRVALAAMACTAVLSLAACSAGIITASPKSPAAPARPAAASRSAPPHSPSASPKPKPSPSPSPSSTVVRVNAPIRSFPIPPGTQVLVNESCPKHVSVMVGPVTPSKAAAFYTAALPRAGYTITGNITGNDPSTGKPVTDLELTGHDFSGMIFAVADASSGQSSNASLGSFEGAMSKNVVEITMSRAGVPDTYICPGP